MAARRLCSTEQRARTRSCMLLRQAWPLLLVHSSGEFRWLRRRANVHFCGDAESGTAVGDAHVHPVAKRAPSARKLVFSDGVRAYHSARFLRWEGSGGTASSPSCSGGRYTGPGGKRRRHGHSACGRVDEGVIDEVGSS